MDLSFSFLHDKYGMPICDCKLNQRKCKCLFDTGASVPVICIPDLLSLFMNQYKYLGMYKLGGFGRDTTEEKVYEINNLVLSDLNNKTIVFRKIPVFVIDRPSFGCSIILSATMLGECQLLIDFCNRNLILKSLKSQYTFARTDDYTPYVCASIE